MTYPPNPLQSLLTTHRLLAETLALLERKPEILTFLHDLHLPITLQNVWDVECGLHSNLPHCCIAFFLLLWSPLSTVPNSPLLPYQKLLDRQQQQTGLFLGYVPCPACFVTKNFAALRTCTCLQAQVSQLQAG